MLFVRFFVRKSNLVSTVSHLSILFSLLQLLRIACFQSMSEDYTIMAACSWQLKSANVGFNLRGYIGMKALYSLNHFLRCLAYSTMIEFTMPFKYPALPWDCNSTDVYS